MTHSWLQAAAEQHCNACERNAPRIVQPAAYDVLKAALRGEMMDLDALVVARSMTASEPHDEIV